MRTFLSLVLFFQTSFLGMCNEVRVDDTKLIRRAYIDILGVLPTVSEMEWFTVYTKGGYSMAVDFLLQKKSFKDKELLKEWLLSDYYKRDNSRLLSIEEIMSIILYLSGNKEGNISFSKAKQKLADNAVLCSSSNSETIEYLCNALLCRDSNLKEINLIEQYIKNHDSDKDLWVGVIDLITSFETFLYK